MFNKTTSPHNVVGLALRASDRLVQRAITERSNATPCAYPGAYPGCPSSRTLCRMSCQVPIQVALTRERYVACLADEGFLPRMDPHVHSQVAIRRERPAAHLAVEGFLPRMRPHVLSQPAGIRERLTACLAGIVRRVQIEPVLLRHGMRLGKLSRRVCRVLVQIESVLFCLGEEPRLGQAR